MEKRKRSKLLGQPSSLSSCVREDNDDDDASMSESDTARGRTRLKSSSTSAKRSATHSVSSRGSRKRRKIPRIEYVTTLNDEITDIVNCTDGHEDASLQTALDTQIGMTVWSFQEKCKLLNAVGRFGCQNVARISRTIGTKSSLETNHFLSLLSKGLREQHLEYRRETILRYAEIPAAFEMSSECIIALDKAAELVRIYQGEDEDRLERSRFGNYWNLNQGVAEAMEDGLVNEERTDTFKFGSEHGSSDESSTEESYYLLKLTHAANLLDLSKWLQLSERIFMNRPSLPKPADEPSVPDPQNWLDITKDANRTPSIYATAFTDFYELACQLTKEIFSAMHMHAISRMRATDFPDASRKEFYTTSDVHTAVSILGRKHDSNAFWAKAAARLGLKVYDPKHREDRPIYKKKNLGRQLAYHEVEHSLREPEKDSDSERGEQIEELGISKKKGDEDIGSDVEQQSDGLIDEDEDEYASEEVSSRSTSSPPPSPRVDLDDRIAAQHEAEAEINDILASTEEEARLWTDALGRLPPEELEVRRGAAKAAAENLTRPTVRRKTEHDFKQFRPASTWDMFWTSVE